MRNVSAFCLQCLPTQQGLYKSLIRDVLSRYRINRAFQHISMRSHRPDSESPHHYPATGTLQIKRHFHKPFPPPQTLHVAISCTTKQNKMFVITQN